jgi:hypothetical protein
MFKKLGITGMVLASVMAVAGPQVASARDRDDVRYSRDARADNVRRERVDSRDRDRRDDRRFNDNDRRVYNRGYYANGSYANGYYDASGCWHLYR